MQPSPRFVASFICLCAAAWQKWRVVGKPVNPKCGRTPCGAGNSVWEIGTTITVTAVQCTVLLAVSGGGWCTVVRSKYHDHMIRP